MFWNKPKWCEFPGCFERHLQRRNGNILFPIERRSISIKEIDNARKKDIVDQEIFEVHLNGLSGQLREVNKMTIAQGGNLLEGFQNLIEEAASIGGKAASRIPNLEEIENDIMQQLNSLMPGGKELLEKAHSLSICARIPYVAQVKRKDTPILEGENIATIFSESFDAIAFIGYCSRFWPNFKPTGEEIKTHLDEAVRNGLDKEKANKLIEAWFKM